MNVLPPDNLPAAPVTGARVQERCACPPHLDAWRCIESRYPRPPFVILDPDYESFGDDDEECSCSCHDDEHPDVWDDLYADPDDESPGRPVSGRGGQRA